MSSIKSAYGTNNQAITCTLTSLANNGQQISDAIDNSTNVFLDALVQVKIKTNASGTLSTGTINVYVVATANGGTDYTDGLTVGNGSVTLTSPPNAILIGVINCVANSITYVGGPFSVAKAFNGVMPDHWAIVVENKTGGTLDASVGSAWYQGTYETVA